MTKRGDPLQSPLREVHPRHAQLAQRIVEAAIAEGWAAGLRMREEELAQRLQVSRTPVRGALRLLARLGIAEASPSRGFLLAKAGETLAGTSLAMPAQPEEELRDALIRDRLSARIGAEHAQVALARQYGVSLPLLQRVLHRMEQEGLVARTGWRWAFVPTLVDGRSQEASYQLRLMVEPAALLLPGFAADPAMLGQLAEDHRMLIQQLHGDGPEPTALFHLDARFHETLASWSGNPFVENLVRQQNALRRLIEFKSYDDRDRVKAWCSEHLEILRVLDAGDCAAASALLHRHLLTAQAAAARRSG